MFVLFGRLTVWFAPQDTDPILTTPTRAVTSSGDRLAGTLSPPPSWPSSPRPKVQRRPSRETTAEWLKPADAQMIFSWGPEDEPAEPDWNERWRNKNMNLTDQYLVVFSVQFCVDLRAFRPFFTSRSRGLEIHNSIDWIGQPTLSQFWRSPDREALQLWKAPQGEVVKKHEKLTLSLKF